MGFFTSEKDIIEIKQYAEQITHTNKNREHLTALFIGLALGVAEQSLLDIDYSKELLKFLADPNNKLKQFRLTSKKLHTYKREHMLSRIAGMGYLNLYRKIYDHASRKVKKQYDNEALLKAAENGASHMVKWIIEHQEINKSGTAIPLKKIFTAACSSGHLEIAKYLWSQMSQSDCFACISPKGQHTLFQTLSAGHLEVAQWLWKMTPPEFRQQALSHLNFLAFETAANHYEMPTVLWMMEQDETHQCLSIAVRKAQQEQDISHNSLTASAISPPKKDFYNQVVNQYIVNWYERTNYTANFSDNNCYKIYNMMRHLIYQLANQPANSPIAHIAFTDNNILKILKYLARHNDVYRYLKDSKQHKHLLNQIAQMESAYKTKLNAIFKPYHPSHTRSNSSNSLKPIDFFAQHPPMLPTKSINLMP